MKKIITSTLLAFVASTGLFAQKNSNKINKTVDKVNNTKNTVQNATSTVTSTVETLTDTKKALTGLFGSRKNNAANASAVVTPQLTISVSNIDIDDENLSLLTDALGKIPNVKSTGVNFDAGTAVIKAAFSGTTMELWKGIPKEARIAFKITRIDDTAIVLEYKNAVAGK